MMTAARVSLVTLLKFLISLDCAAYLRMSRILSVSAVTAMVGVRFLEGTGHTGGHPEGGVIHQKALLDGVHFVNVVCDGRLREYPYSSTHTL